MDPAEVVATAWLRALRARRMSNAAWRVREGSEAGKEGRVWELKRSGLTVGRSPDAHIQLLVGEAGVKPRASPLLRIPLCLSSLPASQKRSRASMRCLSGT